MGCVHGFMEGRNLTKFVRKSTVYEVTLFAFECENQHVNSNEEYGECFLSSIQRGGSPLFPENTKISRDFLHLVLPLSENSAERLTLLLLITIRSFTSQVGLPACHQLFPD